MPHRTLGACLGNIFLGDDGFGVEAARRLAGEPGTVYVIRPEPDQTADADAGLVNSMLFDPHGRQPDVMLGMAGTLGAEAGQVLVVGCQPAGTEPGSQADPADERAGPVPVDDQSQAACTSEGSDQMTAKG